MFLPDHGCVFGHLLTCIHHLSSDSIEGTASKKYSTTTFGTAWNYMDKYIYFASKHFDSAREAVFCPSPKDSSEGS